MSQEIIYTSAPRGLRPGSRGFCTVASTEKMAKPLAERLESLSGYRHLFAPTDASAARNPVLYSHFILNVGGQRFHVLSRIADAGLDYSQRSNKLAHHIAFESGELNEAGPAWSLSQTGLMETEWEGEPKVLSAGRQLPSGESAPHGCATWESVTGDAGWAGVLLESAFKESPQDVYLVFEPGMPLLELLREAESLLPPEKRWTATFSTYFTKLPPGVECRWRCVVKGTTEAETLSRLPHARVIDLCSPLGDPPGNQFVSAARNGSLLPVGSQISLPSDGVEASATCADGTEEDQSDLPPIERKSESPPEWNKRAKAIPPPSNPGSQVQPPALPEERPTQRTNWRVWSSVVLGCVFVALALLLSKNSDFRQFLSLEPASDETQNQTEREQNDDPQFENSKVDKTLVKNSSKQSTDTESIPRAQVDPAKSRNGSKKEDELDKKEEADRDSSAEHTKKEDPRVPETPDKTSEDIAEKEFFTAVSAQRFILQHSSLDRDDSKMKLSIPDSVRAEIYPANKKYILKSVKDGWEITRIEKLLAGQVENKKIGEVSFVSGKLMLVTELDIAKRYKSELSHQFFVLSSKSQNVVHVFALREPYRSEQPLLTTIIGSSVYRIEELITKYDVEKFQLRIEIPGILSEPIYTSSEVAAEVDLLKFEKLRIYWEIQAEVNDGGVGVVGTVHGDIGQIKGAIEKQEVQVINEISRLGAKKKMSAFEKNQFETVLPKRRDFLFREKRRLEHVSSNLTGANRPSAHCTLYARVKGQLIEVFTTRDD